MRLEPSDNGLGRPFAVNVRLEGHYGKRLIVGQSGVVERHHKRHPAKHLDKFGIVFQQRVERRQIPCELRTLANLAYVGKHFAVAHLLNNALNVFQLNYCRRVHRHRIDGRYGVVLLVLEIDVRTAHRRQNHNYCYYE